jgi:hypothetical protein
MGKDGLFGKPSSFPYYFRADRTHLQGHRSDVFTSGSFKTKKAAKEAARSYAPNARPPYRIRVIDRRRGRK